MAITFIKKAKPATVPEAIDEVADDFEMAALQIAIDQAGKLHEAAESTKAKIKQLQASLKPYKEAVDTVQELLAKLNKHPDEKDVILATDFSVEFGAKSVSREIKDMALVRAAMGDELFMKTATVTLKAIDDYLNPEQKAEVLNETRGERSLKFIRRIEKKAG